MKRIIHKLRSYPEHIRIKMLYVATIASAAMLFAAWIFSIGYTVNTTPQTAIKDDLKPFQMLKSSIIDSTSKISWPLDASTKTTQDTANPVVNITVINTDNTEDTTDTTNTTETTVNTTNTNNTVE
jgi:hypothetical protein